MHALFPAGGLGGIYVLSQVGLVLFMFLVGLELRPEALRALAKPLILASQASILVPFLLGGALAWAVHPRLGNGVPRLPFVLFVGAAIAVTAFPVLARILADRGLGRTRIGSVALSCAAFDDLTARSLLAMVTVIVRGGPLASLAWRFTALAAWILTMVYLVRPLIRRLLSPDRPHAAGRFEAVMFLVLVSAWATEALAVHAVFGAFLEGLVMPKGGREEREFRDRLESVTVILFLPLFFAYNGLRTAIGLLNSPGLWLLCGLIVLAAVAGKLLTSAVAVRAGGMPWRHSLAVGVLVNTRGLVEPVMLNVGLDLRIVSPTLFSMMVLMALTTTFMATPLLDRILARIPPGER